MISSIIYLLTLNPAPLSFESSTAALNAHYYQLPGEIMEVVYYYDNGSVKQRGYMQDGELTGTWITYNTKGVVTAKAYYEQGKKTGKWRVYDDTGKLLFRIHYKNDKKLWVQRYDDTGNVAEVALR